MTETLVRDSRFLSLIARSRAATIATRNSLGGASGCVSSSRNGSKSNAGLYHHCAINSTAPFTFSDLPSSGNKVNHSRFAF